MNWTSSSLTAMRANDPAPSTTAMTDLEDRIKATSHVRELLRYINATPELLSLLYDLDLMPEHLKETSWQWRQMLMLAEWHRARFSKTT